MSYQWDNKKPTAQMLGRWQPFHDGHYALFEEIIKKTGLKIEYENSLLQGLKRGIGIYTKNLPDI